ncbi:rod shape-determining protein MreC [Pseudoxanthomonas sp.]|uniref:rod shape-determining protein MreC n=1 Tax=Pseudoxanthomonas sp. TaxID=1871049 RepID=UPI003F7E3E26
MPPYAGPPIASRPGEVASTLRLLGYLALAIALIVLDHRGGWLSQARAQAGVVTQPLWWLAGLPGRVGTRVKDDAVTRTRLMEENRELRNELLVANARLTRLSTAAADNMQLRALLGVAESRGLDVQLAPILDIDLDPTRQRLVLDAGSGDGVRVGQPVIDAGGLMGQIIQVTPAHAIVLLLTDPDHAVPVVVASSGVRLIAYGRGRSDLLELADIPLNSGVKVGDVVVTSGLGGRFPAGFPVGTVTALRPDDSHAFLVGDLRPAAQLDRGRDVLLLRSAPPLRLPLPATRPGATPVDPATVPATPAGSAPTGPASAPAAVGAAPAGAGTAAGNRATGIPQGASPANAASVANPARAPANAATNAPATPPPATPATEPTR